MITSSQSSIQASTDNIVAKGVNRVKLLFKTTKSAQTSSAQSSSSSAVTKESEETYHSWGVRWSGNTGANHTALSPALQSCYTQNITEQNNNKVIQQQNQQRIQTQIKSKEGERDGEKIKLETKQRQKEQLMEEAREHRNKIDEIKSGDGKNIMAKVNFTIGAIIALLLAVYLFVFYSSASFSAFFGNNDISGAGEAILDSHCYAEALANGVGQLLFILLMPVIFLGLGFLIHQFGETESGFVKYLKIGCLYIVTFIFDALLAFEISQKVYEYTVLSDEPYTVEMAFNSPSFWIVIFSGFVAYVIWGMVFDFTLQHFDNMNAHTKEIRVLEGKINSAKIQADELESEISRIQLNINRISTEIASLNTQLQTNSVIDKNILIQALSDFFNGWLAYMSIAAKTQADKNQASLIFNSFISKI